MRHVENAERRARLAHAHGLAPGSGLSDVPAAARALVALHGTEPSSVHLACRARIAGVRVADVERALQEERSLVRSLAMRRTVWALPAELLPAAWGSAGARVAHAERGRMARDLLAAGIATDGGRWLARRRREILDALAAHPDGLTAVQLRREVPRATRKVAVGTNAEWSLPRILTLLNLRGEIVRGRDDGDWRRSRPHWTLTGRWLADPRPALPAADGWRELARRWLRRFGPGTQEDLAWWLGATRGAVRTALEELGAVEVGLDGDRRGWLLPEDLDPPSDPGPWVALLPVLDPTTMGWRERDFYLGPHRARLFDVQGNGGTTVWVDGRIVGCWMQDPAGRVVLHLLEEVRPTARRELRAEADRLGDWLDGERLTTGWSSPAMREARARLDSGAQRVGR